MPRSKATQGKGFLDSLKKGLALTQKLSAATGIKPSDLLAGSSFGQSLGGTLGSAGLASLGLGKKGKGRAKPKGKGRPKGKGKKGGCRGNPACRCGYGRNKSGGARGKCAQCGLGLFDFIGDIAGGLSSGISGIAGKVLNPFARTALPLLAGVAQAGAPLAGALPALIGMGKRGGARYPASGVVGQTAVGVVKF